MAFSTLPPRVKLNTKNHFYYPDAYFGHIIRETQLLRYSDFRMADLDCSLTLLLTHMHSTRLMKPRKIDSSNFEVAKTHGVSMPSSHHFWCISAHASQLQQTDVNLIKRRSKHASKTNNSTL